MRKLTLCLAVMSLVVIEASAAGYQQGWKVYEKPQPGVSYGSYETNPYGEGGSKSYGNGGGKSYGEGGGNSYGVGGGKNIMNPWRVAGEDE